MCDSFLESLVNLARSHKQGIPSRTLTPMAQNGTSPAAEGGRENGASAGAETNRFENGGGLSRRDRGPSVVMGRMLPPSSVQGKVSSLNAPRTLGDARTDVLSGWLDVAVHNRGGQRCSAGTLLSSSHAVCCVLLTLVAQGAKKHLLRARSVEVEERRMRRLVPIPPFCVLRVRCTMSGTDKLISFPGGEEQAWVQPIRGG